MLASARRMAQQVRHQPLGGLFEVGNSFGINGALILGLRPEHAALGPAGAGWPLAVDTVEMLGAERLQ